MEELCNLGFLHEIKEDKSNYYQYNYTITDDGKEFLQQFALDMPNYEEKVEKLKEKSSRFLELVATMFYFDYLPIEEMIGKVHKVKPKQNYSEEEIKEAIQFMKEITLN